MELNTTNITNMEQFNINNYTYNNKYDDIVITSEKFDAVTWNLIEKVPDADEVKRLNILKDLGNATASNNTYTEESKLFTIGANFYLEVRKALKANLILPEAEVIKTSLTNKWVGKTKEEKEDKKKNKFEGLSNKSKKMIEDNVKATIIEKTAGLLGLINDNPKDKNYNDTINNNMNDSIEFRILFLMKIIEASSTRILDSKDNDFKEELLIASKKIIFFLKNIYTRESENQDYHYFKRILKNDDIRLPKQLIVDLETKIATLEKVCSYKLYDVANRRPKLIYDTRYNETIPDTTFKPYDSQIELMNKIRTNLSTGFNLYLKTLPGLGKTTMIVALCQYIKSINSKLTVIFCCSDLLKSVRIQVLKIVFYCGIKFAVATGYNNNNNFKLTKSNNCPSDNDIELIVADYKSTSLLLKRHELDFKKKMENFNNLKKSEQRALLEEKNKYILFFDEPTVLTDRVENKLSLEYLARIIYYIPAHTIFSSATLPMISELEEINNHYKAKYPEGVVDEIISNKTLLGCFIKDFDSNIIVPHSACTNTEELKNLLNGIKNFPLLGKFYTLPFLINLNEFLKTYNKAIELDKVESFDHDNILENIIKLLNNVCELNQEQFDEFKKIQVKDIVEDKFSAKKLKDLEVDFNKVEHDNLILTHAFKFLGCCLIATEDPVEYAKTYFYDIVNSFMDKLKIKSMKKNYEAFKDSKKKYDEDIEAIKKKFTSDDKIEEKVQALKKPEFVFPRKLEINTPEHIKTFAKYVESYDITLTKNYINHESIDVSAYDIDDELRMLLYMGVGVYSNNVDFEYKEKVLELLTDGQLAYIIADESFFYGANYKISNVIINDDIANLHSINAVLQLIGRTARVGKSWAGKVYLDTMTKTRILDLFKNPTFTSDEAVNITNTFINFKNIICEEEINEKNKLEKENKLRKEQIEKEIENQARKEREESEAIYNTIEQEKNERINKWVFARKGNPNSSSENKPVEQVENVLVIEREHSEDEPVREEKPVVAWGNFRNRKSNVEQQVQESLQSTFKVESNNNSNIFKDNKEIVIVREIEEDKFKSEPKNEWGGFRRKKSDISYTNPSPFGSSSSSNKNVTTNTGLFVPKSIDELNNIIEQNKSIQSKPLKPLVNNQDNVNLNIFLGEKHFTKEKDKNVNEKITKEKKEFDNKLSGFANLRRKK